MTAAWVMCAVVVLALFGTTFVSWRRGWGEARAWVVWLFPISQMGLFSYWYASTAPLGLHIGAYAAVLVFGLLCCAVDWFLFTVLKSAAAQAGEFERARMLEERAAAQKAQLDAIEAQQAQARALQGEIVAELQAARDSLAAGDDGACGMEGARAALGSRSQRYCANQALDALLSFKLDRMQAGGIDVDCDVAVPSGVELPSTELCAVFSNMLDNAVRAVEGLPAGERSVELRAAVRAGTLVVRMKNACESDVSAKPARRRDAGAAVPEHGWGLGILEAIAARHDGVFEAKGEGAVFTTMVALPL